MDTELTVAFFPPQYALTLRGVALARLDARLPALNARTPDATLKAVLTDSARLLRAHLSFRGSERRVDASPWSGGGALLGQPVRAAPDLLRLPEPVPTRALRGALRHWTRGTLLAARGDRVTAHLNLADELDCFELAGLLADPHTELHAHRLQPDGQLDACCTAGWAARLS